MTGADSTVAWQEHAKVLLLLLLQRADRGRHISDGELAVEPAECWGRPGGVPCCGLLH